jgi:hypothetical protein
VTDQERTQVLKMIEDGKITPEEGLRLLQTLEQNPAEDIRAFEKAQADSGPSASAMDTFEKTIEGLDPSIRQVAEKVRRLWIIPFGVGVGITYLGGMIMYWNIHPTGVSAWTYCLGLPVLLLGVALMALGTASRTARWLFVHIRGKPGEHPRIMLGFPLPLGLAAWILRTLGHYIPNIEKTAVDEMIVALEQSTSSASPLIVNVDEGENGEKVQVFLG